MDTFIPAYLHALGQHLAEFGDPNELITKLLKATQTMMENNSPGTTLKEKFDQTYYPQIGIDYNELHPVIEDFYSNCFPSLQSLTKSRKDAIELVQKAFMRGYEVAVATNPVFPRTAINQRLEWGDLSPEIYNFATITSYEDFHFAKPNPAYFAEILAQIGWPELPVIMIGNDINADINPAKELGLATFWINQNNDSHKKLIKNEPPSGTGELVEFLDWIDEKPLDHFHPQFESQSAITAILKSTPAALGTITQGMSPKEWSLKVNPNEWSPTEVICHLRDVDNEIYLPRIKKILSTENSFIEAIDADKWAEERKYHEQNGESALQEFIKYRIELLEILETTHNGQWKKETRHTIFGPTTLLELNRISARHDRLHIQQLFHNPYFRK